MTPESLAAYEALEKTGVIRNLWPLQLLTSTFPNLQLGGTIDFAHFWFYSLLAAVVGAVVGLAGLSFSPNIYFVVLHWLLLCVPVILAAKHYGVSGFLAVTLMTLVSPIIWFFDKAQVEFLPIA